MDLKVGRGSVETPYFVTSLRVFPNMFEPSTIPGGGGTGGAVGVFVDRFGERRSPNGTSCVDPLSVHVYTVLRNRLLEYVRRYVSK